MLHRPLLLLCLAVWLGSSAPVSAGPVLVMMDEQADLSAAAMLPTKEAKGRFVFEELVAVAQRTQYRVLERLGAQGVEHKAFYVTNAIWVPEASVELVEQLRGIEGVADVIASPKGSIERPVARRAPSDALTKKAIEWNVEMIRAHEVWAEGITGEGSVVGSIDTGAIWQHPAIKNKYRGWDGATADHNYNWHDAIHVPAPGCDGDSPVPCDADDHGTHTIGTMIGDDGGNNQIGVAPGAKWISCRCWEPVKRTDLAYVMECMEWMLAPTDLHGQNPRPDLAPHVVNNSWICEPVEGCEDPLVLLSTVQNLRAAGIVVVAGAGNNGSQASTIEFPPAIYRESFTVGAVNSSEGIASFSSRGPVAIDGSYRLKPDIVAPGVDVRSAVSGSSYAAWNGTSMAAPHVAGVIALMIQAEPDLAGEVSLIEQIIRNHAYGSGFANNTYGYGRIDALSSVQKAQAIVSNGPTDREPPLPDNSRPLADVRLAQNHPNPFNPLTEIEFELERPGRIHLTIYDASGRKVRGLVEGEIVPAGPHSVRWDGLDDDGASAVSGVYYCRLDGENFTRTRKMALLR